MIESDLKHFADILDSLSDYYQREPLKTMAVKIYFKSLEMYELSVISEAISLHLRDTTSGKYFPKAADLVKHIEGDEITVEYIIAAARLANTPLGIIARIHIGTWDLNNLNGYDLKQKAEECRQLMPTWKEAARLGQYNDHAIELMLKNDVDPLSPFANGLVKPVDQVRLSKMISRVVSLSEDQQMKI